VSILPLFLGDILSAARGTWFLSSSRHRHHPSASGIQAVLDPMAAPHEVTAEVATIVAQRLARHAQPLRPSRFGPDPPRQRRLDGKEGDGEGNLYTAVLVDVEKLKAPEPAPPPLDE
jgi:hypothetical protein